MKGPELDDNAELALPVWARHGAFPKAGEGFGWVDRQGVRHASESEERLSNTIREDRDSSVTLVWTPDAPHCVIPEEVGVLEEPIRDVRRRWAADDLAGAQRRMSWFAIAVAIVISYNVIRSMVVLSGLRRTSGIEMPALDQAEWVLNAFISSTSVGFTIIGFLIFAFIPWYQAQKRMREIRNMESQSVPAIPLIRFETWLNLQKAPMTKVVFGMISMVFLAQAIHDKSIVSFRESVNDAGLVKEAYRGGECFRLLTAPFLHGGIVHFVMNSLALLYLGKRLEVFARWPHIPLVFLFSALVGGEVSARLLEAPSVGASGGLMGWLGFLLIFESLHSRLVPRSSRRRLIGGVAITALIGLVGYRFIDNAAHFGGLIAGMVYAGIVFPPSVSVVRPKVNSVDLAFGLGSTIVITGSAVLATMKIFA